MKEAIAIMMFVLLLCFPGCAREDPLPQEGGYVFSYDACRIAMHAEAAPILAALGEPKSCTEEASCAFDGLDKTYYFGSFYLTTYPMEGTDYIFSLWFADDSVSTPEGIRIGSTREAVDAAYDTSKFQGSNAYIFSSGDMKLTILLEEDVVTSIQYNAMLP